MGESANASSNRSSSFFWTRPSSLPGDEASKELEAAVPGLSGYLAMTGVINMSKGVAHGMQYVVYVHGVRRFGQPCPAIQDSLRKIRYPDHLIRLLDDILEGNVSGWEELLTVDWLAGPRSEDEPGSGEPVSAPTDHQGTAG